jgi:CubicO group peptidase (beta-lactamase class C family)
MRLPSRLSLTPRALLAITSLAAASPALPGAAAAAQAAGAPAPVIPVAAVGAGRDATARAFVAGAASGDSAERARALAAHLTPSALAEHGTETARLFRRVHEQGGPLTVVRVEPAGRNTFVTARSARRPRLLLLDLAWDRADSTRLRHVELLKAWDPAADRVAWPERAPATDAALGALLDRNVGRLAAMGAFSGTVLVARGERVVYARGFGLAERDHGVPNGVDTRYTTASMGKMFTAVAIAQLVEAGRLRLDDTLARVLPDYPNAERAGRVTIRQLLAHTAGLGDIWSHPAFVRGRAYASNRELAWAIADAPLQFAPGTRWSYSNEGYVVLGAVVERLAGTSFEAYLRRHVWGPAGMAATANAGADAVVPHRAVGYTAGDDDPLRVELPRPNWPLVGATSAASGAGGAYATAGDYFRFARALRRGALVRPAMRDTLWAARNPLPWDGTTAYGYGFMRAAVAGRAVVGHSGGGGMGIDNQLAFFADGPAAAAYTVVVLGNGDPPAATTLTAALVKVLAAR